MKSSLMVGLVSLMVCCSLKNVFAVDRFKAIQQVKEALNRAPSDDYLATVVFKAGFKVGDCIEFVGVQPISAGSSGNYEISISYTRGNIASAATHLASVSHGDANLWREVGRTNNNGYVSVATNHNFTVDCNTESFAPRFRLRAINTFGSLNEDINVQVKVRSININSSWTPLAVHGVDLNINKFLAMTVDWSLYVGSNREEDGTNLAIKAIGNGNVGIGTDKPDSKLVVNGNIHAKEIKVSNDIWPDYVFDKSYDLPTLEQTAKYIEEKGHLPGIPSALEVKNKGIELGEMNAKLLQKIEELTLYLIELQKDNKEIKLRLSKFENESKNGIKR